MVHKGNLPLNLCYHEETLKEIQRHINFGKKSLQTGRWTPSNSRMALDTIELTPIEKKFHELNRWNQTEASLFFSKYERLEELLADYGFVLHPTSRIPLNITQEGEVDNIRRSHEEFLSLNGLREKTPNALDHDARTWYTVSQLRNPETHSLLDAKALLLTVDFRLFLWDKKIRHSPSRFGSVVLPANLIQLLRFFVSPDDRTNRGFIEAFAVPEVRSIASPEVETTKRKILTYATNYADLPEATALRLLADRVLNARLRDVEPDTQAFREIFDDALLKANESLAQQAQDAQEQARTAERARNLEAEGKAVLTAQLESAKHERDVQEKLAIERQDEISRQAEEHRRAQEEVLASVADLQRLSETQAAQIERQEEEQRKRALAHDALVRKRWLISKWVAVGIILAGGSWIEHLCISLHLHPVGLFLCLIVFTVCLCLLVFYPKSWAVWVALIGAAVIGASPIVDTEPVPVSSSKSLPTNIRSLSTQKHKNGSHSQ